MSERGEVEINAIIRGAPLNRFHILIVTLCTTVAIFDGFDTQIIAYVGLMIVRDFHIPSRRSAPCSAPAWSG
jgi:AAHS family 4-hydroxybenzoate transporter-like MFS transporter